MKFHQSQKLKDGSRLVTLQVNEDLWAKVGAAGVQCAEMSLGAPSLRPPIDAACLMLSTGTSWITADPKWGMSAKIGGQNRWPGYGIVDGWRRLGA